MENILSSGSEFPSRYRDTLEIPDECEIPTYTAQTRVSIANLLGGYVRGAFKGIPPWKHHGVMFGFADRVQDPKYNPDGSWHRALLLMNQQISEVLGSDAVKNPVIRSHFLRELQELFPL